MCDRRDSLVRGWLTSLLVITATVVLAGPAAGGTVAHAGFDRPDER